MARWVNKAVPSIDRKNLLNLVSLTQDTRLVQQSRDKRRKRLTMGRNQADRVTGIRLDDRDHPDSLMKTE